jgi:predicted transposase/invertase (TIGR01784 family)
VNPLAEISNKNEEINKDRKAYDAYAKSLLAHKEVLANILKYTVREFKDYSLPEIISCLNGKPEIGTEPVDDEDIPTKMDVAGTETVSTKDGIRSFDIKFKVRIPGDDKESDLIINIESQNKYNPGYTLEKRGIYYLSRLISSQYNVEFTKSNFDKLKKCYSIWICVNAPQETANTVTEYRFKPEHIVGEVPDCPQKYDLMSLIMINLGSKDKNYSGVIKMLDQLLVELENNRKTATDILENEYQIYYKTIEEEALGMCNLSSGIYEKGMDKGFALGKDEGKAEGRAEGRAEGKAEGKAEGSILKSVQVVQNLLEKNFTLEEALPIADIDKETYKKYVGKEE